METPKEAKPGKTGKDVIKEVDADLARYTIWLDIMEKLSIHPDPYVRGALQENPHLPSYLKEEAK